MPAICSGWNTRSAGAAANAELPYRRGANTAGPHPRRSLWFFKSGPCQSSSTLGRMPTFFFMKLLQGSQSRICFQNPKPRTFGPKHRPRVRHVATLTSPRRTRCYSTLPNRSCGAPPWSPPMSHRSRNRCVQYAMCVWLVVFFIGARRKTYCV